MATSSTSLETKAAPFADVTVAAYYYPCQHTDPRWDRAKYPGFTEWDLIKAAQPRFPGHRQPTRPVWGYEDECEPAVMARKIDTAADHGVSVFLFDWYYYNDGPYLQRSLDEAYLTAPNNHRTKFALMWANHDWFDIQGYDPREELKLLYPGQITPATWEIISDLVVARYFSHPSYWKIDARPYSPSTKSINFSKASVPSRRHGPRWIASAPRRSRRACRGFISTPFAGASRTCPAAPRPPTGRAFAANSRSTA